MADYLESLFQGIDIIVGKRLESVSYDTTIVCTVTDDSDAKNGQYLVSDGSTNFLAYSEKDDYKKNDSVRVLIPQGNKSESKYIIGKAVSGATSTPLTFVSSLDSTVNIEEISVNNTLYGLKANDLNKEILIKQLVFDNSINSSDNVIKLDENIIKSNFCNTITLSGEFKTLLSSYELKAGSYGLRLRIYEQVDDNPKQWREHTAEFSSEEMFGNPYMFSIYSLQGKVFGAAALGTLDRVKEIDIYLYQDDNFVDANNQRIDANKFLTDNILVKNIQIGLGTNVIDVENNTLTLYTYDNPNFDYDKKTEDDNKRKLQFLWFNKGEDNRFIGFSDNRIDNIDYEDGTFKTPFEYDEMEYLDLNYKNIQLQSKLNIANTPTNEDGLNLASDIDIVKNRVNSAINIYKVNVSNHLRKLKLAVNALEGDPIGAYLDNLNNTILTIENNSLNSLVSYYENVLQYGYETQTNLAHERTWSSAWVILENHKALGNTLISLQNNLNNLITNTLALCFKEIFQATFASYRSLLEQDLEQINGLVGQGGNEAAVDRVLYQPTANINKLAKYSPNGAYNSSDKIIAWEPISLDKYANRYCIYWYRYKEGYISTDKYKFMGDNWERIGNINDGLPEIEDGQFLAKSEYHRSVVLNHSQQTEKFVMVIFYNHNKYISNELEFTNIVDIARREDAAVTGAINIEHLEKSKGAYFDYSIAKTLSIPIESLYPRQIRARLINSETDEASLNGRTITWLFPATLATMLKEYSELEARGFIKAQIDDNWFGFSKEIKYNNNDKTFVSGDYDTRDFWYCIKDYYNSTALQNTIRCQITDAIGNRIEGSISFEFGTEGTNGTPYTLRVVPETKQRAVTDNFPLRLNLSVINELDEEIKGISFTVKEICGSGSGSIVIDGNTLVAQNRYGLVEISTKIDGVELSLNYSIPYTNDESFTYQLSGVVDVVYDSQGGLNSNYPNIPYEFYPSLPLSAVQIKYYQNNDREVSVEKKFYPILKNNYLIMPNIYITNTEAYSKVIVTAQNGIVWYQFLNIVQNRFSSSVLNGWDGSFQIDEDKGTILSTMIGAGQKNSDNSFSGVLMGDITSGAETDVTGIGLYGYHKGAQSFGLNIDGSAFFGKSGRGRIIFEGDSGSIQSGSWSSGEGMLIDLDDGIIDIIRGDNKFYLSGADGLFQIGLKEKTLLEIGENFYFLQSYNYVENTSGTKFNLDTGEINSYNFKLNSNGIKLNANPNNNEYYLYIGPSSNGDYISFAKNGTLDIKFSSLTITPSQLELKESYGIYFQDGKFIINASNITSGVVQSKNYSETNGVATNGICFNLDNNTIKSKNFTVDSDGNVTVAGTITAEKGEIGGWTINSDYLGGSSIFLSYDGRDATNKAAGNYVIGVGEYNAETSSNTTKTYFSVTKSGKVTMTNATFNGWIYAWGGSIGGINISDSSIGTTNWSLNNAGAQFGDLMIKAGRIGYPNASGEHPYGGIEFDTSGNIKLNGNLIGASGNINIIGSNINVAATSTSSSKILYNVSTDKIQADYATSAESATNASKIYINSLETDDRYSTYVAGTGSAVGTYGYIRRSTTSIGSIASGSSQRFKNTISENLNSEILYSLKPVSYFYNKEMGYGKDKRYGFIAEEVDKIAPELVEHDYEDNSLCNALYYNSIITLAVAEIQKLRKEIDILKEKKEND